MTLESISSMNPPRVPRPTRSLSKDLAGFGDTEC